MQPTKIEWATHVHNPCTGCLHNCSYCYARPMGRMGRFGHNGFTPTFHPQKLFNGLNTKKPALIFLGSVADIFGDWNWIRADLDIEQEVSRRFVHTSLLSMVKRCPQHIFISLTKNPKGAQGIDFPENWWIGTSIENQAAANKRIPELLEVKAHLLLSIEPMQGPINLMSFDVDGGTYFPLAGDVGVEGRGHCKGPKIEWVIVGAETGPKAKPVEQSWIISILDQCQDNFYTPVFVKNNTGFPGVQEWPEPMQEIIKARRPGHDH